MPNVGFYGGSEIRDLGPASDMLTFFNCVRVVASRLLPDLDSSLLTDRLYRRYLKLDELDPTTDLIAHLQKVLISLPADCINWNALGWKESSTKLDPTLSNIAEVLARYLDGAVDLIRNAKKFEKRFHIYKPVITIITDTPRFYVESNRPLADYDALEGEPMWLR